tara:strand:- start:810 stop:1685 length:876 start_codon:yes stop_codon:yes gene_type:complete
MPPTSQGTLAYLRIQAEQQLLPKTFLKCASPLSFLDEKKREHVVEYMFQVASEFDLQHETVVRAIQLFDRYTWRWNLETSEEWVRSEKALEMYKRTMRLVLVRRLDPDCVDHVLSFIQRPPIPKHVKKNHFNLMRDGAETTAIVCLCLSSKFSERAYVAYKDAVVILANRVTVAHMKRHEERVLQKIEWRLNLLNAYQFVDLLNKNIGFVPDPAFNAMMKRTMKTLAPLHQLQDKSVCTVAAIAMLSVFKRQEPEATYSTHLKAISAACGLSGRHEVALEQSVNMAVVMLG